jgi:O-acetyl-ADP-ribose deacetylase (regulator of RNase III)
MISVRVLELADARTSAVLRPVAADWSAVTPAMRRLELAAGADVHAQCLRLGELPVGSALITGAGELHARFMVHVVVRSLDEPVTVRGVRQALLNGLRRLVEWGIDSVTLPPLGTGAGNLDAEEAAQLMVPILAAHVEAGPVPSQFEVAVETEYEHAAFVRELAALAAVDARAARQD